MPNASLDAFSRARLDALERRRLHRELQTTDRGAAPRARRRGRPLVSFSCNDYLGLSRDPRVISAAVDATHRYGAGAGASRLVTGNHPLYDALEHRLAAFKGGHGQAVVFGSGYLANLGIIQVFAGSRDLVLVDELAHSCLLAGAAVSQARTVTFRHNDVEDAAAKLANHRGAYRHCLLVTEGVFSMDGDRAPLRELAAIASRFDAWLLVDDAHGFGVLGDGRGATHAHAPSVEVPLSMGTLSKALGAYGGYLCASEPVCDLVRNRARSFIYTTGLPPGTVAAALASLDIIEHEPARVAAPLERARLFTSALGLADAESAIVPVVLGSAARALEASAALERAGFLVTAIRPPTVPQGTARLRFAFSALHTSEDVLAVAAAVSPFLH